MLLQEVARALQWISGGLRGVLERRRCVSEGSRGFQRGCMVSQERSWGYHGCSRESQGVLGDLRSKGFQGHFKWLHEDFRESPGRFKESRGNFGSLRGISNNFRNVSGGLKHI